MATFLTPDKIRKEKMGKQTITVKEKIIPDSARATKNVASYVQKGEAMKPLAKLGTNGKPRGITVHNTGDIKVPAGTTPAEQYTRATWPNQNMGGVVVHYYVWKDDIWQNLRENEQGWHASDGDSRRTSHRKGEKIGGNVDTIAIECIGEDPKSEESTAKLVALLLTKFSLSPETDVYTHNYFKGMPDKIVSGAGKNCPVYILPHWDAFLKAVKQYYKAANTTEPEKPEPKPEPKALAEPIKKGDIVCFSGGLHYSSSNAASSGGAKRTAGKAKVTNTAPKSKHPYHLVGEPCGSNVYGWVDADTVTK